MSNNVLKNRPEFQSPQSRWVEEQLNNSTGITPKGVMTYENTLRKIAFLFGILTLSAVVGFMFLPPVALIPLLIAGLVLGLINAFKKEVSPVLISLYAVAEGGLLGVISRMYEQGWGGIVMQATLATLAVSAAVLALFIFGGFRATKKLNKIFMVVLIAYLLYSLTNLLLVVAGVINVPFGLNGIEIFGMPLGIIVGALAVILCSYMLIQDFTMIENAVQNKADEKQGWYAGFALMVTIVWMYLEILRLIALTRK
jgi:uncharacterized YccA/Bax inhibitor family protein